MGFHSGQIDNADGEMENGLHENTIRAVAGDRLADDRHVPETATYRFYEHQHVLVNFDGTEIQFEGKITKANGDDATYEVEYFNGNTETNVEARFIESLDLSEDELTSRPAITEGLRVQTRYTGGTTWLDGTVAAANTDGTFDIALDDGDTDSGVTEKLIKFNHVRIAEAVESADLLEDTKAEGALTEAVGSCYPNDTSEKSVGRYTTSPSMDDASVEKVDVIKSASIDTVEEELDIPSTTSTPATPGKCCTLL